MNEKRKVTVRRASRGKKQFENEKDIRAKSSFPSEKN